MSPSTMKDYGLHLAKSFKRQYANTQEQEQAEDILQRGIHMKGEDLDGYISRYEALVIEAGYDQNDRLCL